MDIPNRGPNGPKLESIARRRLALATTPQERFVRAMALALIQASAVSLPAPAGSLPKATEQVGSPARRNGARRGRFSPPSYTPGGGLTPNIPAGGKGPIGPTQLEKV